MTSDSFRHLDTLASHLPFAVDDYAAAGRAFARWRTSGLDEDLRCVQLWTYCYALRYVLTRFLRERTTLPSDVDEVIAECYERTFRSLDAVREPERYASFVSVICKRALLNHRERRREMVEPEDHLLPVAPPERTGTDEYDGALIRRAVERVILQLPEAIRPIARMRLLEQREYEWIAEATNRPIATVRTYVSKALALLRTNEQLRALYFDDILPPPAGEGLPPPDHG